MYAPLGVYSGNVSESFSRSVIKLYGEPSAVRARVQSVGIYIYVYMNIYIYISVLYRLSLHKCDGGRSGSAKTSALFV